MPAVKRITDLSDYTTVLPYASEMFGIYQPLLGWKSTRMQSRFETGLRADRRVLLDRLTREFSAVADVRYGPDGQVAIAIDPGSLKDGRVRRFDSVVLEQMAKQLPPFKDYSPSIWNRVITAEQLSTVLKKDLPGIYSESLGQSRTSETGVAVASARSASSVRTLAAIEHQMQYESSVAGALLFLAKEKNHEALKQLFYTSRDNVERARAISRAVTAEDAATAYLDIESLDPDDAEHIRSVALSPIAVVHLFRQYFFELDSFLGTPERHVWLSPGSSVELIEVHTRRTTVERTLANEFETTTTSEVVTTEQEELSEAVKQDNSQDIKFGAAVTASYGSIEASSSFDYTGSQKTAREQTHKRMRQQTEKLSSQIRKNFKSTFKTVTEMTDLSSTKHLLANTTNSLINYELRRKMRQVGVQVQDIGTFLCWQTYVDDPGAVLGLAKLVHIAQPSALDSIPHPEEIPQLQGFSETHLVTIPFISVENNADSEDEVYVDGVEKDNTEWFGELEKIQADFTQDFICPRSGYELADVEFDPMGAPVVASRRGAIANAGDRASFVLHLDTVDFRGQNNVQMNLVLHWQPTAAANAAITAQNQSNVAAFKAQERAAYEKAYIETVKERVTMASKIAPRPSDELREEERIVVYRKLIQDFLMNKIELPDDRTRHVVAELINSIFDVDKMLYFVAPEWWRPRLHHSRQQLQPTPEPSFDFSGVTGVTAQNALQRGLARRFSTSALRGAAGIMNSSSVGWGGIEDSQRDNYFITDESAPAKLGSSLGWLLQLDGDNRRNAFLNAPWVKAVIPIRPGKEKAAINWLKGVEGMNGITDDVIYHASNPDEKDSNGQPLEGQKMIDVLMDLAAKIAAKYRQGVETDTFPKTDEVTDPALVDDENTVTATPIDRVYEHGFFPLEGSFRANVGKHYEIFDQWIEILPTDQIVPVEVKYDARTGRMITE